MADRSLLTKAKTARAIDAAYDGLRRQGLAVENFKIAVYGDHVELLPVNGNAAPHVAGVEADLDDELAEWRKNNAHG